MKLLSILSIVLLILVFLHYFQTKKQENFDDYSSIIDDLKNSESNNNNSPPSPQKSINEQFEELKDMENKCHDYFKEINTKYEEKKKEELEKMNKELELQDRKIRELEKLVKSLRNQYLLRKGVTNKCREKTQNQLESDVTTIAKLAEENKLVNQNVNVDLVVKPDKKNFEDIQIPNVNSNKLVNIGDSNVAERINSLTNSEMGTDLNEDAKFLSRQ